MRRRVKSKLVASVPIVLFAFVLYGGAVMLVSWVRS
jgi:hypothetical protein